MNGTASSRNTPMHLHILGTRGEIPKSAPRHRFHSGVLINGKVMLDLGERTFLRFKPLAIFITHLHPDHAAFVREPFAIRIPTYAPELGRYPFLRIAHAITIDTHKVRPLPTHHSSKVGSYAYLVEHLGKKILYTGDIVWMDAKYRKQVGKLDCVITEASYLREGGLVRKDKRGKLYGHAGIPNLVRMFKPHTKRIILTHFGSWFFKDIEKSRRALAALAKKHKVEIIVGYDGMTLSV